MAWGKSPRSDMAPATTMRPSVTSAADGDTAPSSCHSASTSAQRPRALWQSASTGCCSTEPLSSRKASSSLAASLKRPVRYIASPYNSRTSATSEASRTSDTNNRRQSSNRSSRKARAASSNLLAARRPSVSPSVRTNSTRGSPSGRCTRGSGRRSRAGGPFRSGLRSADGRAATATGASPAAASPRGPAPAPGASGLRRDPGFWTRLPAPLRAILPHSCGPASVRHCGFALRGSASPRDRDPALRGSASPRDRDPALRGSASPRDRDPALRGSASPRDRDPALDGSASPRSASPRDRDPALRGSASPRDRDPALDGPERLAWGDDLAPDPEGGVRFLPAPDPDLEPLGSLPVRRCTRPGFLRLGGMVGSLPSRE